MLVLETGYKRSIAHVAFAPDGRALVAGGDHGAYWRIGIADRAKAEHLPAARQSGNACFTSDGRWLFAGGSELYRIDPQTGAGSFFRLWDGFSTRFDVSPTASHVLVAQTFRANDAWFTRMALWRAEDLSPTGRVWEQDLTHFNYFPLQFLADGDQFARVEYDANKPRRQRKYHVVIHETATGMSIVERPIAIQPPHKWLIGPDGNLFVTQTSAHIYLHRLDAPDAGSVLLSNDSRRHFTGIALHPTGRFLAAASNDHSVKLYDPTTGDVVRTFTWQLGRMRSIAFSPDGTLAAAGSDNGQVVVWDVDL